MTDETNARAIVKRHTDLDVYRRRFAVAMRVFELSRQFPAEERYSLTDQMRRSSRSVCANLTEAWRKRRWEAAFVAKLGDNEAEAAETQTWIQFAVECKDLDPETGRELYKEYDAILGMIVMMIRNASLWVIRK